MTGIASTGGRGLDRGTGSRSGTGSRGGLLARAGWDYIIPETRVWIMFCDIGLYLYNFTRHLQVSTNNSLSNIFFVDNHCDRRDNNNNTNNTRRRLHPHHPARPLNPGGEPFVRRSAGGGCLRRARLRRLETFKATARPRPALAPRSLAVAFRGGGTIN